MKKVLIIPKLNIQDNLAKYQCSEGHNATSDGCSLLLDQMQDGYDGDQVLLVVTRAIGTNLEPGSVGKIDLDLYCFPLLEKIGQGNIWDGRLNGRRAFLALSILDAFQWGLEICAHSALPEQSLQ